MTEQSAHALLSQTLAATLASVRARNGRALAPEQGAIGAGDQGPNKADNDKASRPDDEPNKAPGGADPISNQTAADPNPGGAEDDSKLSADPDAEGSADPVVTTDQNAKEEEVVAPPCPESAGSEKGKLTDLLTG